MESRAVHESDQELNIVIKDWTKLGASLSFLFAVF